MLQDQSFKTVPLYDLRRSYSKLSSKWASKLSSDRRAVPTKWWTLNINLDISRLRIWTLIVQREACCPRILHNLVRQKPLLPIDKDFLKINKLKFFNAFSGHECVLRFQDYVGIDDDHRRCYSHTLYRGRISKVCTYPGWLEICLKEMS